MRTRTFLLVAIVMLFCGSCSRRDEDAAERKVGKVAHKIAIESEKAAKEAARAVGHATHEAHEGWKEADRKEKPKDKE
jgi:hypothetical protein